jgi:hypothetical protein
MKFQISTLRSNLKACTAALLLAGLTTASSFGSVVLYAFDGGAATPTTVDPNATATSFSLNPASTVSFFQGNPTTGSAISGTGWNVTDGSKYWEFTVTANAGFNIDLSSLTFDDQKSSTGPTGWTVTVNGTTVASGQTTHSPFGGNTISLTGIPFQDLAAADVKIYGFGASGSGGTWRVDNVTLNGSVDRGAAAVPDSLPFAYAAMALIGIMLLGRANKDRLAIVRVRK